MLMDKQLRRILNLVRKTGDRMVVTDTNGEDVYVVMGLEQYESLVDSCPDDFDYAGVDKRDNDGPYMGGGFDEPELDIPEEYYVPRPPVSPVVSADTSTEPPDIWDLMQPAGEGGSTWDLEKLTGAERKDLEEQFVEYQRRKATEEARLNSEGAELAERAVGAVKQSTTSVPLTPNLSTDTHDTQKDEEFGEEQFYLEPIE